MSEILKYRTRCESIGDAGIAALIPGLHAAAAAPLKSIEVRENELFFDGFKAVLQFALDEAAKGHEKAPPVIVHTNFGPAMSYVFNLDMSGNKKAGRDWNEGQIEDAFEALGWSADCTPNGRSKYGTQNSSDDSDSQDESGGGDEGDY